MRAFIFNSGLGSRLGELTAERPKCLVRLGSGETILHRQLRVLSACGVRDFVITTGPFAALVEAEARAFEARGCRFAFVGNERYAETNYLYSFWLARDELRGGDVLMLHGDLVFDAAYVRAMLDAPAGSWGAVNPSLPQPEKDFKARVVDGEIREVGVGIFDADCVASQGFYRLSAAALATWLDEVGRFVERGETGVYAENAANAVFADMHVRALSYEGHFVEEVDTPEDLTRVSAGIELADAEAQPAFVAAEGGALELAAGAFPWAGPAGAGVAPGTLAGLLAALGCERPLVVCDPFFAGRLDSLLGGALAGCSRFSGYAPNPTYEQVVAGVDAYRREGCDGLVSLGGGSAIDVAKCVGLWAGLPGDGRDERFADLPAGPAYVPHLAIPTTAGTGSEATHFAVVYVDGEKRSVAHPTLLPDAALLVPGLLAGLPAYQRAATMLDALCQAVESSWSRRSSATSRAHAARAIPALVASASAYLAGDASVARAVALAADEAGRAINQTTTTAPHAMSYKLTSRFGLAHGHAVALCMGPVWARLLSTAQGPTRERLAEVDALMTGQPGAPWGSGIDVFRRILAETRLAAPDNVGEEDLELLAASVNAQRLSNHPETLTPSDLRALYAEALRAN